MSKILNKTLTVPEDVLFQELSNGEIIFLNLDNESYYGLDNTGSLIWKELMNTKNIENAYNNLLEVFDVTPRKLRDDLESLLKELEKNGVVKFSEK